MAEIHEVPRLAALSSTIAQDFALYDNPSFLHAYDQLIGDQASFGFTELKGAPPNYD